MNILMNYDVPQAKPRQEVKHEKDKVALVHAEEEKKTASKPKGETNNKVQKPGANRNKTGETIPH